MQIVSEAIGSLHASLDLQIQGDDIRHLLSNLESTRAEFQRVMSRPTKEVYDLKSLYDEIRRIEFGLRVLKNNIDICSEYIEDSKAALNKMSQELTQADEDSNL